MSKDLVEEMAHASIESFIDNDGEIAKTLAPTEKDVDSIYSEYLDELFKAPPGTKC